jgi:enoyl-CoA hydratase/carnithine racemase
MAKQFTTLDIRRAEGTCWISFIRPKVMNAFNRTQWLELNEALADSERDETIRCVVLRGAGGNFSSGYD